jgi:phosphate transport system protein
MDSMSTRATYEHQLQELSDLVVTMASMVDKAIARSMEALRLQNVALAQDVRRSDTAINNLHRQGEEMLNMLIATQGPVGRDLRLITSTMAVLSNLERMGDYAAGIAKIVVATADQDLIKPLVDLPRMGQIAREMLNDAITAYIERDAEMARQISVRDDEVDDLYDMIFRELITFMRTDTGAIDGATRLMWVAHNVERIADRVTNLCERIVFIATGEFEELDTGRYDRQKFSRNGSSDNGISGNA